MQGGLAALGLVAAHLTWQREPERAPGAVTVIDASKADVTLVRYEDDRAASTSTRGHGGDEPAVWLHIVTKPKAEPSPTRKAGRSREPPSPARRRRAICPAPRTRCKLYDQFAPLVSPRAFGVLDATKLKELGLDAPKRKLEVTVKGDVRRYDIGQPGERDRRARRSCATRATGAST